MSDEFGAWEPEEPPRGFAERVVAATRSDGRRPRVPSTRRRAAVIAVVAGGLAAAAAAAFVLRGDPPTHGAAAASIRKEVALGPRAIAVLEPGAQIAWNGDRVTQARGNVFYRVEPGAAFQVHTIAGDVTVKGTCFRVKFREEPQMNARDVKVGVVGAVVGAAAFVGVYEGKVALSQPKGGSVDVGAGQSAVADGRGVRAAGSLDDGEKHFGDGAPGEDEPLLAANASLADSVRTYKGRLEAIEDEKKKLEKDLGEAQTKLAASMDGAVLGSKKSDFDLTDQDWKQMAKEGKVRARYPCGQADKWVFGPKALDKMGLRADDAKPIAAAFAASQKRRWSAIRPLCTQSLGGGSAADVADKIGEEACVAVIMTMASQKDSAAADEAVRLAAEVRAGERPMPGPDEQINPVERMMLALTAESKNVEADLTKSIGPDDAHRLVFSDDSEGCWHNTGWGVGPRPRP